MMGGLVVTKTADALREFVTNILLAAGADQWNADGCAEHLVLANLSGVDTHGIWPLPLYVQAIKAGELLPTQRPEVVRETETTALVRGNYTFGHVTARLATEVAIEKAKAWGVAVVSMVEANHIGRLGHFVEMAAAERLIAMVWSGGFGEVEPVAVPYGGRKSVLHTNPIAIGFPTSNEPPMMFDFATTKLSGVKVANAHRRNQPLSPGAVVDKHGNPTTNASDFFDGGAAVLFGEHKGYGLAMAGEYLGRIVGGADDFADERRGGATMRHQGVTIIVLKPDLFQPFESYAARADEMVQRVRAIPPAPGFDEVLAPGDMEARTREIRRRDGIPIEDDTWESIVTVAKSLGVEPI